MTHGPHERLQRRTFDAERVLVHLRVRFSSTSTLPKTEEIVLQTIKVRDGAYSYPHAWIERGVPRACERFNVLGCNDFGTPSPSIMDML